jgi:hypothetical protein
MIVLREGLQPVLSSSQAMASHTAPQSSENTAKHVDLSGITPQESLEYTHELVESLQKMAQKQGHKLLAQILGLAAREAKSLLDGED